MLAEPRSRAARRADTERLLAREFDVWVATASGNGAPYLVPLSFHWDGAVLLMATSARSPTGRNLSASGTVRLAVGQTRDVCLIEGEVDVLAMDALGPRQAEQFVAHAGFDPRLPGTDHLWFRVRPRRIQAWREVNEQPEREIMADGRWLA